MILVSGAAGKTGQAVIRALTGHGQAVRAMIARPEQAQTCLSAGAQETVIADFLDPEAVQKACRGTDKVYHICPNMHPQEVEIGKTMLEAARRGGVSHFVFHSVLHPQVEAMPHHYQKMKVEDLIFASGIDFTILQPAAYMQNIRGYWKQIIEEGVYALPYCAGARLSTVDLDDVAATAAVVMQDERHIGATYELVGEACISPQDTASILSRLLGKTVRFEQIPLKEWEAKASCLEHYQRETLLKMFAYYDAYGLYGSTAVLAFLLGRAPHRLEEILKSWIG